ncbi:MAG: hypothetical protein ACE5EE_07635 [Fidelibacterota bacterium]
MRYQFFGHYWDYPITESQGIAGEAITAVYFDLHTQILWAATSQGLNYSIDGGARWYLASAEILGLRPGEEILRIGSTSNYLWCITQSQVMKIDRLSGYLISPYASLPDNDINWGSAVTSGNVDWNEFFQGYTATGGWMFHGNQLRGSLNEEVMISTVYLDRFGDIWVGTFNGPVFYADPQMMTLEPLPFGPAQTNTTVLLYDGTTLWLGGHASRLDNSGITRYDYERGYWDVFRKGKEIMFGSDNVFASVVVGDEVWFGTSTEIQIYDKQKNSWYQVGENKLLLEGSIKALAFDGSYVYIGTSYGLIRMNPSTRKRSPWQEGDEIRGFTVHDLFFDGEALWISWGINNLWKWIPSTNQLETFRDLPYSADKGFNLVELHARKQAMTANGNEVFFGDEYGILIYNKSLNRWQSMKGAGRLVGHQYLDLLVTVDPESGLRYLWAAMLDGLYQVNLDNYQITYLTREDGLPDNKVYALSSAGGYLWIGTPSGLTQFDWQRYVE